ncbi:MAG TPA: hypothetical protein VN456_07295 [Desulfosporosinus sp.]|nr:hypothetical protein [Desulfosporosinus sp.]
MTYFHRIAFLACRIISVYLLAKWLGLFGSSVVTLFYLPPNTPTILGGVVSMAFPVVIGILLWIFSAKLAGFMVKTPEGQEAEMMSATSATSATFDLETVQILAFTIIGVLLIVNAVPSLISALTVYAVLPEHNVGQVGLESLSRLVDSAIRIILGLWLVLRSKGLVNLIKKIRTAGVK